MQLLVLARGCCCGILCCSWLLHRFISFIRGYLLPRFVLFGLCWLFVCVVWCPSLIAGCCNCQTNMFSRCVHFCHWFWLQLVSFSICMIFFCELDGPVAASFCSVHSRLVVAAFGAFCSRLLLRNLCCLLAAGCCVISYHLFAATCCVILCRSVLAHCLVPLIGWLLQFWN